MTLLAAILASRDYVETNRLRLHSRPFPLHTLFLLSSFTLIPKVNQYADRLTFV